jgi:hypothetical protein
MKCNIVGCGKIEGGRFEDGICLPCYAFITTGERAWVGLTDEEIRHIQAICHLKDVGYDNFIMRFARAILRKAQEK